MKKILIISFMLTLSLHASNPGAEEGTLSMLSKAFVQWINEDVKTIPNSALNKAIEKGYYNTANMLLKTGIRPTADEQEFLLNTVLENAIKYPSNQQNYLKTIELLLKYNLKPTGENSINQCLVYAIETENIAIIDLFINKNNINQKIDGLSLIDIAINPSLSVLSYGDDDTQSSGQSLRYLLTLIETDSTIAASSRALKLDFALCGKDNVDTIDLLVKKGSNPEDDVSSYPEEPQNENPYLTNNNALTLALALHKNEIVRYFLTLKKDSAPAVSLLRKRPKQITPLHAAIRFNNVEGFNAVITEAINRGQLSEVLNATDRNGRTPLHTAACDGRVDFISALVRLTQENDWYKEDDNKNIPIMNAIQNGHQDAANILGGAMKMRLPIKVKDTKKPTFLELYEAREGQRDKRECWENH